MNILGERAEALREPAIASVPNGEKTSDGAGTWTLMPPFFLPAYIPARVVNAGEISAQTGSVATNNSPGFLGSLGRDYAKIGEDTRDTVKSIAGGVGSVITSLFPWWFWALLGLGLIAYVLTILLPYVKKPA